VSTKKLLVGFDGIDRFTAHRELFSDARFVFVRPTSPLVIGITGIVQVLVHVDAVNQTIATVRVRKGHASAAGVVQTGPGTSSFVQIDLIAVRVYTVFTPFLVQMGSVGCFGCVGPAHTVGKSGNVRLILALGNVNAGTVPRAFRSLEWFG
jgi:hypothetical protein